MQSMIKSPTVVDKKINYLNAKLREAERQGEKS